jgi:hypothetical protein
MNAVLVALLVTASTVSDPASADPTSPSQLDRGTMKRLIVINSEGDGYLLAQAEVSGPEIVSGPAADALDNSYVAFPTEGVKLRRPKGFDDAVDFRGFFLEEAISSIMIVSMPAPFSAISGSFTSDNLATKGVTLVSTEEVSVDGFAGVLLNVTQVASEIEFTKWMLVFGNEEKTTMINATFPSDYKDAMSERLKTVLLTTKLDSRPPPPLGSDVGFTITVSEKMQLTQEIGKMLLYTKDGTMPQKSPEDPFFIVGKSFSKVPIKDKKGFAQNRLKAIDNTRILSLSSFNAITVDGIQGFEIIADAENQRAGGVPIIVYQIVLFDEGSYYLMQGLVGRKGRSEIVPEFKKMARSFERKK